MALRDTLLLVDDQKSGRTILRRIFEDTYNLLEAENGEQALLLLEQHQSCIAVMLLDLVMPVMDGFELLAAMKERGLLLNIPVLIISSMDSPDHEMKAFDLGASDIILKPFEPMLVRRRVENIVELNSHKWHLQELVEQQSQTLRHSHDMIVDTLTSLIEHRSLESGQHILRIRGFTRLLLQELARSYPEYELTPLSIDLISRASALHDIGKISIPDAVLNKPGRLTPEEFEVMKGHSAIGSQMLVKLPRTGNEEYLNYAHDICRHHHERWDGHGYPDGLAYDNIPIAAQVVGLADAYDALTTKRVYKPALPHDRAAEMILNGECGVFSPKLLDCFRHLSGEFAQLAQKYADGAPAGDESGFYLSDLLPAPTATAVRPSEEIVQDIATLQLAQSKYRALLYYMDATVMEADPDQGLLRMVCDPSPDFAFLHSADTLKDALDRMLEQAIHPDDRDRVALAIPALMQDILKSGLRHRTLRYRILNKPSGQYRWYDMAMLRVDSAAHERHCFLCVWTLVDSSADPDQASDSHTSHPDLFSLSEGMLCCRNDLYFTLESGVAEELSPLCGYTPREISEQFDNHMFDLILPEDRINVHRQLASQLSFGNVVDLEYRLQHKSGQPVWVHEKSRLFVDEEGAEHLFCFLFDVNQFKLTENTLRHDLDRYRLIHEQSDEIIAEWNVETDTIVYSSGWKKLFGFDPIDAEFSSRVRRASHIHPDDLPLLNEKIKGFRSVGYQDLELRIANASGHYLWCRFRGRAQYTEDGNLRRVVVLITNIDAEKRSAQALRSLAERDSLTQLLNRGSAQKQIAERLSEVSSNDRCALLIVDLDHFKTVNDTFGHIFGDEVLIRLSSTLRDMFRSSDIIARAGGDEFMIFMDCVSDDAIVRTRCARLLLAVHDIFRDEMAESRLTCSIGVAFSPEHGQTFPHLYRHADIALYQAKTQGRNCFVCYNIDETASAPALTPGSRTPIDSDREKPQK